MSGVLVIGAGLTGLSTAYHLAERGVEATVLERLDHAGGACATLHAGEYDFDLTGHLLHLAREESTVLLRTLGVYRRLRRHRRRAGIALAGAVTPYPIQIHTHRLPPAIRRECLLGFIRAHAGGAASEGGSFAEWVLSRFGEGLARHFFFPYNRKLFRVPPEELTSEWVGRYVPRPDLEEVVDGALGLFRGSVGYNASFLYPREGGIELLAAALAATCGGLRLGVEVRELCLAERSLTLGSGESLAWDALVATMPLDRLAAITVDLPAEARAAAARLRAVAVLNCNLGVRGPAPRREHWLYVPEERFPFYRVGFPSNHGVLAPQGCHTISVEVSAQGGARPSEELEERCLQGLGELGLLAGRDAIEERVWAVVDPAYVVFDVARPWAVAALRAAFRRHGVVVAGRWAEWKYSTMEDALWDGATAARRVAG